MAGPGKPRSALDTFSSSPDMTSMDHAMTIFRRLVGASSVLAVTGCVFEGTPAPVTLDPGLAHGIATADSLVASGIGKLTRGAVLVVSKNGHIVPCAHLSSPIGKTVSRVN